MIMIKVVVVITVIVGYLIYSPFLLDIEPVFYVPPELVPLTGPLAPNEHLIKTEKLLKGCIKAPESLALLNGKLYTGTKNGYVVQVKNNEKIINVASFGSDCAGPWEQELCGRPLGIRASQGVLFVVDAYKGMHVVNVTSGESRELLNGYLIVDNKTLLFLDNLDVDEKNGKVYVTQFSTKWTSNAVMFSYTERENSGRVLCYDLVTRKVEVLMDNLYGANGIQLTLDKSAILVAETWTWRILRYELEGPKKGQVSIFAQLPGEVDNLVASPRGTYWATVVKIHSSRDLQIVLAAYPTVRKVIARTLHCVGSALFALADIFSHVGLKQFAHDVRFGMIMNNIVVQHCMIVELDTQGRILRSLQSSDTDTCCFTEVAEDEKYLYLGSFLNSYLGRLEI